MIDLPDEMIDRPKLETGYYDGSLPSWQQHAGTEFTSSDAGTQAGRVILNAGSASLGDESRLETTMTWDLEWHDIISVKIEGFASTDSQDNLELGIGVGNGSDNFVEFQPNRGRIEAQDDGTSTTADTYGISAANRFDAEMRWYLERGYAEAIFAGKVVGKIDTGLPPRGRGDMRPMWRAITQSTSSDRKLNIYGTAARYYDDKQFR